MMKSVTALLLCTSLLGCATHSGTDSPDSSQAPEGAGEYNYAKLQTKSLDDMNAVVRRQLVKAKNFFKDDDQESAVAALQAAAQYTLSRPDRDNMVSKVIAPVRTELKDMDMLETTMQNIVINSIKGLNNTNLRAADRATYYFVLINYMSEFKPELKMNPRTRNTFEQIAKAKIKIDGKVENDLTLRAMNGRAKSPSDIATTVLKNVKTTALKYEEPQDDLEKEP